MLTTDLTLIQKRALTRILELGLTTVAGFSREYEYGINESRNALISLRDKGLVSANGYNWLLTDEGKRYAQYLED